MKKITSTIELVHLLGAQAIGIDLPEMSEKVRLIERSGCKISFN